LALRFFLFTSPQSRLRSIPVEFDLKPGPGREQNEKARAFSKLFQSLVRSRFWGIALDLATANATNRRAHARIQQSQIVVNFGLGGHGRTRIACRVLLPNRDRRSDAAYFIHIQLVHTLAEV